MKRGQSKPTVKWDLVPFRFLPYGEVSAQRRAANYGMIDPKKVDQIMDLKLSREGS